MLLLPLYNTSSRPPVQDLRYENDESETARSFDSGYRVQVCPKVRGPGGVIFFSSSKPGKAPSTFP